MRRSQSKEFFCILLAVVLWTPGAGLADQPPPLTLQDFMSLALKYNPGVVASQAQRDAARAGERTAAAYPNPTIEAGAGPSFYKDGREGMDGNWAFGVSQPIDYPALRSFRIQGARAGTGSAQAGLQAFQITLLADVKAAFYDVIRRQGERQIASEDFTLLEQVRTRVKVRVDTGEAPKYELIKADAELLNAQKTLQSAELRVRQAKATLSRLVGTALGEDFDVSGDLSAPRELPALAELREEVLARSPVMAQSRAEQARARARLNLERELRIPQMAIRAGVDRDPDLQNWRLGLSLLVPVWDRREGPIAEAAAGIAQVDAQAEQRKLILLRDLDTAYNQYLINVSQVSAYEGGLLTQAEAALNVAGAAYRFGERGILDYLDAQRIYRSVRLDYLNTRFDLQRSLIEIERLRASDPRRELP
ncbi:MAG TPA: TolC family protein [Candidatus Acidoferrum sp.]|nr:TolC family protein [Candidatus Acidoferrum sp.]